MKLPLTIPNRPCLYGVITRALIIIAFAGGLHILSTRDLAPIVSPVQAHERTILLRSDRMGHGHFGARRSGGRRHKGIDIEAEIGSPVMAAKGGKVIASERSPKGIGEYITIDHGQGIQTQYGHLKTRWVKVGARVRQGDPIGLVGKSGNADHPDMTAHVHFELIVNGKRTNPATPQWLLALYTIRENSEFQEHKMAQGGNE
jgi:murein DD-endopeptidase MepM/ murein hydrolase activator NlpD